MSETQLIIAFLQTFIVFWLNEAGINGIYTKETVKHENFGSFIVNAAKKGYSGLNITVPFKEKAFKLCDVLSETAKELGAVNLIIFENGKIMGDNTDGQGFIDSVIEKIPNLSFKKNNFQFLVPEGLQRELSMLSAKTVQKILTLLIET